MTASSLLKHPVLREILFLAVLLMIGIAILPPAIYFVGELVFGAYGGDGLGSFFGELIGKLGHGDGFAWILVLSPYIITQLIRLMALGWRATGTSQH